MWAYFGTAAAVIFFDQNVKFLVRSGMKQYQSITVIKDFFHITYIENFGIAFGIFGQDANPVKKYLLLFVVLTAMVFITIYWMRYSSHHVLFDLACGLILGGAAGNFIDRFVRGSVTDFLEFGIRNHRFAVFNIADSAVTVGVTLFIIYIVFVNEQKKAEAKENNDASGAV
jgi:signal peptidase II